jgi:hypothetical protein
VTGCEAFGVGTAPRLLQDLSSASGLGMPVAPNASMTVLPSTCACNVSCAVERPLSTDFCTTSSVCPAFATAWNWVEIQSADCPDSASIAMIAAAVPTPPNMWRSSRAPVHSEASRKRLKRPSPVDLRFKEEDGELSCDKGARSFCGQYEVTHQAYPTVRQKE